MNVADFLTTFGFIASVITIIMAWREINQSRKQRLKEIDSENKHRLQEIAARQAQYEEIKKLADREKRENQRIEVILKERGGDERKISVSKIPRRSLTRGEVQGRLRTLPRIEGVDQYSILYLSNDSFTEEIDQAKYRYR